MKSLFNIFSIASALATGSINAETTLITQAEFGAGGDLGNWRAQAFKLSDSGFKSQGDPINSSPVSLSSITLIKGKPRLSGVETSPGQLSLVIMRDPLRIESIQLVSSNKINIREVSANEPMKFTFNSKSKLHPNQKYWIRAVIDNGNGSIGKEDTFALFRANIGGNTIAGETWGESSNELSSGADVRADLDLKFELNKSVKGEKINAIVTVGGVTLGFK